MKKLLCTLVTVALCGCYQVTSSGDIQESTLFCANHGGINHITVNALGMENVVCQDEAFLTLHRVGDTI